MHRQRKRAKETRTLIDPNWVGAVGQWAGALATVAAVLVALWQARKGTMLAMEARYDSARPVLVISNPPSDPSGALYTVYMQADHPTWLDWNRDKHYATLQNIGAGTAFNTMSVLYGPESLVVDLNKRVDDRRGDHWTCMVGNIRNGQEQQCGYKKGASLFLQGRTILEGYAFNAPAQPFYNPLRQEPTYTCRIITTYHDIFGRRHASVFDREAISGDWVMCACLSNCKHDLLDLEGFPRQQQIQKGWRGWFRLRQRSRALH